MREYGSCVFHTPILLLIREKVTRLNFSCFFFLILVVIFVCVVCWLYKKKHKHLTLPPPLHSWGVDFVQQSVCLFVCFVHSVLFFLFQGIYVRVLQGEGQEKIRVDIFSITKYVVYSFLFVCFFLVSRHVWILISFLFLYFEILQLRLACSNNAEP